MTTVDKVRSFRRRLIIHMRDDGGLVQTARAELVRCKQCGYVMEAESRADGLTVESEQWRVFKDNFVVFLSTRKIELPIIVTGRPDPT